MKQWTKAEIQREAEKLLRGEKCPVQIVALANKLGLEVLKATFNRQDVAGMIMAQDKKIFICENDNPQRRRFSIAHEIGHYILHYKSGELKDQEAEKYVSFRDSVSSLAFDIREIEANYFAANLLMPEREIKRLLKGAYSLDEMAIYFNVSKMAMGYRLESLDYA